MQTEGELQEVSVCVCLKNSKGIGVAALEPVARRWLKIEPRETIVRIWDFYLREMGSQ